MNQVVAFAFPSDYFFKRLSHYMSFIRKFFLPVLKLSRFLYHYFLKTFLAKMLEFQRFVLAH